MELHERLLTTPPVTSTTGQDPFSDLKDRLHLAVIGELGPQLFNVNMDPAGLREASRQAVNAWIRTSGAFDGVIDFDAVVRDPADPLRLNPAYDSGDHLHPDDAGYQAMADAVNPEMLLPQHASAAH